MRQAGTGRHSLRRRLLLLLLGAIALFAAVQGTSAYRGALQQADEMFDYHLQQMALSLRGRMGAQPFGDLPDTDSDFSIQIWGPDGTPLLYGTDGPPPGYPMDGPSPGYAPDLQPMGYPRSP